MNKSFSVLMGAVMALGVASGAAHAATVAFPGAGASYLSQSNGGGVLGAGGQTGYMWTTGDYIDETFVIPGLTSVSSLSTTAIINNVLGGGNNLQIDAFINGVDVGSSTALDCNYCGVNMPLSFNFTFAPITSAGVWDLTLVLENNIPGGGGSIAFVDGGTTTLNAAGGVPEPATWAMLLVGFGGIGGIARMQRRRQALAA